MTKEHIEKVIRSNRPGIAAHQLWKEIQAHREQWEKDHNVCADALAAIAAAEGSDQ